MGEVVVMGAGIFGLTLAFVLSRRGAQVRVIERAHPGAGSSGGLVGALAPHVPEAWNAKKAFQFESLLMAAPFWAEVHEISGRDPGFARLGRVQPLADDAAVHRARTRALEAETLWRGAAHWQVIPQADAPGPLLQGPGDWVVFDTLSARLSPPMALEALTTALARLGVPIEQGTAPPRSAQSVVWATGAAGLDDLTSALGQPMGRAVKGQAAAFAANWPGMPQFFAQGLHIVPHANGTVAIGSTSETGFDAPDTTDSLLDGLIAQARALLPALAKANVCARWAGLRPRAPSRAPMLGAWPGRPGHFVMNGGFKIGFGMAPKLAMVMADLVLDGQDAIPPGFRVEDNLKPL
jgi:glycine oxidase